MLLRRFMQHVRVQDWFAVALDILVVIIGIFLGLQFTEWHQSRKDNEAGREYLERILTDLNTSLEHQAFDLEFIGKNYEAYEFVLERLLAGELSDEQRPAFNRGLTIGGRANPIRYIETAFVELQSSGRVGLIEDVEVRKALGDLSAYHDFKLIQMEYPHGSLTHSRNILKSYYFADWEEVGDYDFDELVNSKAFIRAARSLQKSYGTIRLFHRDFNEETLRVRDQVQAYLELSREKD